MKYAIATQGDRLDQIVYQYYKTLDVLGEVMMSNPDLLNKALLDEGDRVALPDIAIEAQTETGVSLW